MLFICLVVQAVTCEPVSARELTGQNRIFGRFCRLERAGNAQLSVASCVNSRETALGNCLVLNGNSISGAGKLSGDFQVQDLLAAHPAGSRPPNLTNARALSISKALHSRPVPIRSSGALRRNFR
jgi:hypothetical protein